MCWGKRRCCEFLRFSLAGALRGFRGRALRVFALQKLGSREKLRRDFSLRREGVAKKPQALERGGIKIAGENPADNFDCQFFTSLQNDFSNIFRN